MAYRKWAAASTIVLIALGFMLEGRWNSQPEGLPLRIAVSHTPLSTPFFVAAEKGFFREQGLNIQLQLHPGGHKCFESLVQGHVDLATSSDSVIMFNSFKRDDFSVLTSFVQSDNDIKIIAHADREITAPSDLVGKRVGIVPNSASEFFLYTLLLVNGVQPSQIVMVPLPANKMANALASNQVDAVSIWEPYGYDAFIQLDKNPQTIRAQGLYNLSFNLISMRHSADDIRHRDSHQRLLRALSQATKFIARHPETAQRITTDKLGMAPAAIRHSWRDYVFSLSLSNSLISTLESEAHWAVSQQRVLNTKIPDYRSYINGSALLAAEPSASLLR